MNKEILEKALEMMAANDKFDMHSVSHDCDTPACIAGHVLAAAGSVARLTHAPSIVMRQAAKHAELTSREMNELFAPTGEYSYVACAGDDDYITREHAVRCLRKFIDTGEIDWNGTAEKGEAQ